MKTKAIVVYCDGSGQRPDGTGSGIAWICPETGDKHVERIEGLTNNQAEYRALLSALGARKVRSQVTIFTDSQLVCGQLSKGWKIKDPELQKLAAEVRRLARTRKLHFTVSWIPGTQNKADKLLR